MIYFLKLGLGFIVGQIIGSVYRAGHLGIGASLLTAMVLTFILCMLLDLTFSNGNKDDNKKD